MINKKIMYMAGVVLASLSLGAMTAQTVNAAPTNPIRQGKKLNLTRKATIFYHTLRTQPRQLTALSIHHMFMIKMVSQFQVSLLNKALKLKILAIKKLMNGHSFKLEKTNTLKLITY